MKSAIPLLLLSFAVHAQGPQLPPSGGAATWPTFDPAIHEPGYPFTGSSTSLVTGAFVDDHPGRCVALMRGGELYLSFQPRLMKHFVGVPTPTSLAPTTNRAARQLGTLPNLSGDNADRLAAITTSGVDIWSYNGVAFVSTLSAPDSTFAGATEIRTGVHHNSIGSEHHFLTFNSDWVHGGIITSAGAILPGLRINSPPSASIWDATTVDWIPGGLPEFAILASNGMFVFDALGNLLDSQLFSTDRGSLCSIELGGTAGLCAVIPSGTQWTARTWQAGSTTTWDAPSFSLPDTPNGIIAADLTADGYSEVSISTTDNRERIMLGTVNGPSAANGIYVRKHAPSTTLNGTTAVLDDIDRNGELDLVMQCDGPNELNVYTDLPENFSAAAGEIYLSEETPGLADPEIRGVVYWESIPSGTFPQTLPPGYHGLVVRFDLPAGIVDDMQIRCYQYELNDGKIVPDVVDAWHAPLTQAASSSKFDMIVPLPVAAPGLAVDRALEFMLVDAEAGEPVSATSSVFGRFFSDTSIDSSSALVANQIVSTVPIWLLKNYILSPEVDENGDNEEYLFSQVWADLSIPLLTAQTTIPFDPGAHSSRYIGSYEPTGELDASAERPDASQLPEIPSDIPL